MFERFTERARQVVVHAQNEAREHNQPHIGCEHLLAGLLLEPEGLGARVLTELGLSVENVRAAYGSPDAERREGQLPFTPRAKQALEMALREALILGHNHVGTEHILLGLARGRDGAASLLDEAGIRIADVRDLVLRRLQGGPHAQPAFGHVSLSLSHATATWLFEQMGSRPHTETESREVWDALRQALTGRTSHAA